MSLLRFKGLRSLPHSTFLLFIFLDAFTTGQTDVIRGEQQNGKNRKSSRRSREKNPLSRARDFYQSLLLSFVCGQIRGFTAVYRAADWSIVGYGANQQQKSPAGIFYLAMHLRPIYIYIVPYSGNKQAWKELSNFCRKCFQIIDFIDRTWFRLYRRSIDLFHLR